MSEGLQISQAIRNLWIAAFGIAALLFIVLGHLQYKAEEAQTLSDRAQELTAIGTLKAGQIAEWRKERLSDTIRFARGPTLTRAIEKNDREDLRVMLSLNRKGDFYEDALLVSAASEMIASATIHPEPLTDASRWAIDQAMSTRKPALSDFYRSMDDIVHIDVAAPVYYGENGQSVAVFVLRCAASDFLYPLIQSWPASSSSAETLLVRREGDMVVFLNKLRHERHGAMTLKIPLKNADLPAAQAILGKQGIIQGTDYRGVRVLADVRPIPSSDWFLITKIDSSEVFGLLRKRALVISGFVLLGILFAASATAFGFRNRQASLYRHLYRSEQEQCVANEKFRTILYSIGDAVITTDAQGCVRQMNRIAVNLTGWSEAEALGRPLEDVFRIVNEDTRSPVQSPARNVLLKGQIVGLANHTTLISRDGREYPITDSGAPVRDEQGNVTGVVLVFRDQSAERDIQNDLARSERRLFTLMNNFPGIVYRCSLDTYWTMEFISKGCKELTGYDEVALLDNEVVSFFDLIHPDDRQRVWDTVNAAVKRGETYTLEYRIKTADGTEKWVWERGCSVRNKGGNEEALEGVIHDITERKKAAEEQAKLTEQLHQSQKIEAIGRLAGGVAHDFNNMLMVIVGNSEMIQEQLSPESALQPAVQEILKAGKRSTELVKQLLGFASKQNCLPNRLDLNRTIGSISAMLRRLGGEANTFEWRPGNALWPVMMDPNQVEQILVSLVVNARDALTDAGKISIETGNVSQYKVSDGTPPGAAYGDYVHISVSDNGRGMDAALQTQIFEPFFTTKPNGIGNGLGLPMVYGIVKQNNGFIRVVSQPGKGSCFHLYLPRYYPAQTIADAASSDASGTVPRVPVPTSDSSGHVPETILLVEDEASVLNLTHALLKKMGYNVLIANGPKEALQRVREYTGEIHLLLSDMVMPDMNGLDLWKRLVGERPTLKCLFMSGYTADIIAHHGMLGADIPFLQKPFTKDALVGKLREALS